MVLWIPTAEWSSFINHYSRSHNTHSNKGFGHIKYIFLSISEVKWWHGMPQWYYCFYLFLFKKAIAKAILIFAVNWEGSAIPEKHELIKLRTETNSIVFYF